MRVRLSTCSLVWARRGDPIGTPTEKLSRAVRRRQNDMEMSGIETQQIESRATPVHWQQDSLLFGTLILPRYTMSLNPSLA